MQIPPFGKVDLNYQFEIYITGLFRGKVRVLNINAGILPNYSWGEVLEARVETIFRIRNYMFPVICLTFDKTGYIAFNAELDHPFLADTSILINTSCPTSGT